MNRNMRSALIYIAADCLRGFGGHNLTREQATALLPLWPHVESLSDDMRVEVLGHFRLDEPLMVPGVDYLAEVEPEHVEKVVVYRGEHSGWVGICVCGHETRYFADRVSALLHLSSHIVKATEQVSADADTIKAESLAEPKAERYRDRDGDVWVKTDDGRYANERRDGSASNVLRYDLDRVERKWGPLVEVQPDVEVQP